MFLMQKNQPGHLEFSRLSKLRAAPVHVVTKTDSPAAGLIANGPSYLANLACHEIGPTGG